MHNKQYQQPSLYIMEVGTTDMIAFSVNTPFRQADIHW